MLINGAPGGGNLYFRAYCFTGERPETDWQGRREVVIDQGMYTSIRKFQLYVERSKKFEVKTITHEKYEMAGKALENRRFLKERLSHAPV
jgi:hypothetical protein